MFALYDKERQSYVKDANGDVITYESGTEAAERAKAYTQECGIKYQPRKYVDPKSSEDWRDRERSRFESGEYLRVLPELEAHCLPDHFVHASKKRPSELAYTKDDVDGASDLQKRISVRGYLEQFVPSVSMERREELADAHQEHFIGVIVQFAKTPKDIEKVYTNYSYSQDGVNESCMRYDVGCGPFESHIHPVRIYGAGDLAVAYLTNEDGKTVARALCWPEKRIYSRVYGQEQRLHDLLKSMGYSKSRSYYAGSEGASFNGARVLRIENEDGGGYVAPYIDGSSGLSFTGDSKYFILSDEPEYACGEQDGTTGGSDDRCACERCQDPVDETTGVHTGLHTVEYWCSDCCDEHTFYCAGSSSYYATAHFDSVQISYNTYEQGYAERNYYYCETCSEWSRSSLVEVITSEDGDAEEMCRDCAEKDAFRCVVDGALYATDLVVEGSLERQYRWPYQSGRFIGNVDPSRSLMPYHCDDPSQLALGV